MNGSSVHHDYHDLFFMLMVGNGKLLRRWLLLPTVATDAASGHPSAAASCRRWSPW